VGAKRRLSEIEPGFLHQDPVGAAEGQATVMLDYSGQSSSGHACCRAICGKVDLGGAGFMDDQTLLKRNRLPVDEGSDSDGSVAPRVNVNGLGRQVQGDAGGPY
jgi:hypothetical protein